MAIYQVRVTAKWAASFGNIGGAFSGLVEAEDMYEAMDKVGENVGQFANGANKAQEITGLVPPGVPPLSHIVHVGGIHIDEMFTEPLNRTAPDAFDHWLAAPRWIV
jgi:hypothetical protein